VRPQRLVIIGDVMLDVVVRPLGPVAPTSDTASEVRLSRGGSGANIAVAAAAHGCDVVYVGAAGDDAGGRSFIEDLTRAGVVARVGIVPSPTGVVVALVAPDGQRAMLTDRGANRSLSLDHVMDCLAAPFDHLHVSGYTLLDAATRATGVAALAEARGRGMTTSVDVCSVAPLREMSAEAFLSATTGSTWLVANQEEALSLSGADEVDSALDRLSLHFAEVVVTRGPLGAVVRTRTERFSAPSASAEIVDTTGAGDAATGSYLASRLQGSSIDDSLEVAMRSAADVVGGLGASGWTAS